MANEHPWDSVSSELTHWLQEDSKWLAQAIRGDHASPFAAKASEAEKLDYYRRQFYTQEPDGTINYDKPNQQGRQTLIARVGIDTYADIARAISPGKTASASEPTTPEAEYSEGY